MRVATIILIFLSSLGAAQAADIYSCQIAPDKRSVSVLVSNPYAKETHCTVNCHVALTGGGISSISCTKTVPADAKDFVMCTRTSKDPEYSKLRDAGDADCVKPLALRSEEEKVCDAAKAKQK